MLHCLRNGYKPKQTGFLIPLGHPCFDCLIFLWRLFPADGRMLPLCSVLLPSDHRTLTAEVPEGRTDALQTLSPFLTSTLVLRDGSIFPTVTFCGLFDELYSSNRLLHITLYVRSTLVSCTGVCSQAQRAHSSPS